MAAIGRAGVPELQDVAGAYAEVLRGIARGAKRGGFLGLGKSDNAIASVKKAAGMMYRGVAY